MVKVTFHRDIVDVIAFDGGHLAALHFRDPLVGVQNKNIEVFAAFAALNRCGAGIPGGRSHHHDFLIAALQYIVQQPAQHLQGKVLEGQCRALEQLQNPLVLINLYQRRNRVMTKICIAVVDDGTQILVRNGAIDKGFYNFKGQLRIGQVRPGRYLFRAVGRQGFRHIQAAIRRQASEQNVFKVQGGRFAAGADVFHVSPSLLHCGSQPCWRSTPDLNPFACKASSHATLNPPVTQPESGQPLQRCCRAPESSPPPPSGISHA